MEVFDNEALRIFTDIFIDLELFHFSLTFDFSFFLKTFKSSHSLMQQLVYTLNSFYIDLEGHEVFRWWTGMLLLINTDIYDVLAILLAFSCLVKQIFILLVVHLVSNQPFLYPYWLSIEIHYEFHRHSENFHLRAQAFQQSYLQNSAL